MISWAKKENGRDGKIVLIQGTLENPRIYIIVPDTIRRPPSNDDPSSYPASKQDRLQEQQHLQNYNQISESDEDYREMGSQS